ncbi:MAG: potassium/proton antiporter [Bacteroidales bacterium]|nr:potassium/proton antiporter [Bacteroidales bacterium]
MTATNIILIGSILIFVSILVGKTGSRFGIPSLLLFLIVGMGFGESGLGIIHFFNVDIAQFIGMIALSIILFSGGMDTQFKDIKPILWQGIALSTMGVLLTAIITGLFIFWISGFDFTIIYLPLATSILLAATMSSTDSASVFNILRSQKINLKYNLKSTLELESGSNDPMAYMLTIALIQFVTTSSMGAGAVFMSFILQFAIGGAVGFMIGTFAVKLINKINLSIPSLYSLLLLSLVFFTFAITDMIKGNGYLAVYIAGIIIGNNKIVNKKEIATFMDGMTNMVQMIMFLSLGLLVNAREMLDIIPVSIAIGVFMIFIGRPLSVFVTLLPFTKMKAKAKLFVSWVGLRGAVPIIFATYPVVAGVEHSDQIFNIVFVITLMSLIIQGMTIPSAARALNMIDHSPKHEESHFGMELPDEIDANLKELILTEKMLEHGNQLKTMHLPDRTLVIMIKRGERILIPNGSLELQVGDRLLFLSEEEHSNFL